MKKKSVFVSIIIASFFFFWIGHSNNVMGLKQDADAGWRLDTLRRDLSNYAKMKPADARSYYEDALEDLNMLIREYADTEEALEARFYVGTIHNEIGNFDEAIKYFDDVLGQEEIDHNFKARLLYFKAKALLGNGDVAKAKEVVAELRLIEPGAANAFGKELSGTIRLGMKAPDFNVMDFNGDPVNLSKYKGNIVVIDFWATWCDPCLQEFPKVKKMYRAFKGRGVQFIGVSLDDEIEDLKGFVGVEKIEWPQVFEGMRWKGTMSKMYNVEKIPIMFVLDRESRVQYIGNDKEKITRVIAKLLSKSQQEVEPPMVR
ncbi:MAG: redoxin domain-containing protein [Planctomycetota bacterium]